MDNLFPVFASSEYLYATMNQTRPAYLFVLLLCLCLGRLAANAQVPDEFHSAYTLVPPSGAFDTGTFQSKAFAMADATVSPGEFFPDDMVRAGNIERSLWFKFEIASTRNVRVWLKQTDSAIYQSDVGMSVYKDPGNNILKRDLNYSLPPLPKMGFVESSCLSPGIYYIQVSSRIRVVDSLFIELRIQLPDESVSQIYPAPQLREIVPDYFYQANSDAECAFLISPNQYPGQQSHAYSRAISYQIKVSSTQEQLKIQYRNTKHYSGKVFKTLVLLLKEDSTKSTLLWQIVDSASYLNQFNISKTYNCFAPTVLPVGTYRLVFLMEQERYPDVYVAFHRVDFPSAVNNNNPKQLQASHKLGTLASQTLYDSFACDAFSNLHSCSNLYSDTYWMYDFQTKDSLFFELESWYTFRLLEEKQVRFIFGNSSFRTSAILYSGNAEQSCNLSPLQNPSITQCLAPGEYSLRLLGSTNSSFGIIASYNPVKITVEVVTPQVYPILFSDSLAPDNLGDITLSFPQMAYSQPAYMHAKLDSFYLNGTFVKGNFLYREFYIGKETPLLINSTAPLYFFKGRKSLINDIDSFILQTTGSFGGVRLGYVCNKLPIGWYTIIQYTSNFPNCVTASLKPDQISFEQISACPLANQLGGLANPSLLNLGQAIQGKDTLVQGIQLSQNVSYELKNKCLTCSDILPELRQYAPASCANYTPATGAFGAVEFELASEMSLRIFTSSSLIRSILFKGSLKADTSQWRDSSRYMAECQSSEFCNLPSGKYTVLFFGEVGTYSLTFHFKTSPLFQHTEVEFAENLGIIGPQEVSSKPVVYHCSLGNDTLYKEANYRLTDSREPLNGLGIRRNLGSKHAYFFYRLGAVGQGNFLIKSGGEAQLFEVVPGFPIQNYTGNKALRDSLRTKLKPISSKNTVLTISKPSCDYRDYILAVKGAYSIDGLQFCKVSFDPKKPSTTQSDVCSQAITQVLSDTGTYSLTFNPSCATIGEGFGEDGKNMACLPFSENYGTFWVKVSVQKPGLHDIIFQLKPGSALQGNYASSIKYRILYGSCSALTPGPCLSNLYSKIGFDCIAPGDYYLQIASPIFLQAHMNKQDYLELVVELKNVDRPDCNPFLADKPLASFAYSGHCAGDSLRFFNYGSQGDDIEYLWDFGDGTTSSLKDPSHRYVFSEEYKDVKVRLFVRNKVLWYADSMERSIRVFNKVPLPVLSLYDTLIQCGSEVEIKAEEDSLSVYFIKYNWLDTLFQSSIKGHFYIPITYQFFRSYYGCIGDTTASIQVDQYRDLLPEDTTICGQPSISLQLSGYNSYYWWPSYEITPDITVHDTGTYSVTVRDGNCYYKDTVRVKGKYPAVFIPSIDTLLCSFDSVNYSIPNYIHSILWQDQDTSRVRWFKQPGTYALTAQWESCALSDELKISMLDLDTLLIPYDSLCEGESLELKSLVGGLNYYWSTGERTESIQVQEAGNYMLTASLEHCSSNDSLQVSFYPPTLELGPDSLYCGTISLQLDAGQGSNYLWIPGSQTGQYYTVQDSGTYLAYKTNVYGCEEADTIRFSENCGPWFLMPTAFTPNKDGKNELLQWSHLDVREFQLIIFDRWGEVVYQTNTVDAYWDGRILNELAMDGIYLYHVTYGGSDHRGQYHRKSEKGHFVLLR